MKWAAYLGIPPWAERMVFFWSYNPWWKALWLTWRYRQYHAASLASVPETEWHTITITADAE